MTAITISHPLDPLRTEEIVAVAAAVRAAAQYGDLSALVRFITIDLREPDKAAVLDWSRNGGELPPRDAEVVLLDGGDGATHEVTVALDGEARVVAWRRRDDVQPMAVVGELMVAEELVKHDERFRAALARRGITDFEAVQVDAWPAGNFNYEDEVGRRLARCVVFIRPAGEENEWAHPVDGLIALVDLNRQQILRVEDHGEVPIPTEPGDFDATAAGPLRDDIAPLEIVLPQGAGFTVDGNVIRWQRWELHVGFTSREGLVLNQVGYHDRGLLRSIIYRASLSEMIVPYGDPSPTHYFKNAMDAGENGVGVCASSLELGCDCLGEIFYLEANVADADGAPVTIPNAICIHEEDVGVLWRHIDWRRGAGEVRRSRRLVISSFSAIGNYDYGFFWYLYQDGTIEYEIKLTGVLSTGGVAPDEKPRYGTLVAPGLNAMIHQHFFNMRLDLDVDGLENAVEEVWTESEPLGPSNPHGNAYRAHRRRFASERGAIRRTDPASARWWEIVNPRIRHRLGAPVGYRLIPGENAVPFAAPEAAVSKRAGFVREHLWVTPYDRGERFAAGEYPNQHPGGAGLPEWTSADRPIDCRDIVVWYTFGHHHVPRPEDWPVMPVATIGFKLKPVGFFDRNPSLDVPPSVPHRSHRARDGGGAPS
ncbi:MAG: primary-amine oxidase [Solirubrobacterales bacterium]|nr:primary-amine oxidase [Solirubrobacterales bacterium]